MKSAAEQLADLGVTAGSEDSRDFWSGGSKPDAVVDGPELRRILSLPRRPPPAAQPDARELAPFLTERLARVADPYPVGRQYGGNGYLNATQAAALRELWTYRGLFGPIRPGAGKTLLSALACTVMGAQRPLYICPSALRIDVKREFEKFAKDWHTPRPDLTRGYWQPGTVKILSAQTFGVEGSGKRHDAQGHLIRDDLLSRLNPDLVLIDETHLFKDLESARTKRLHRWILANEHVPIVPVSGTMMRDSLLNYAHLAYWGMRKMCPVPISSRERHAWADALDERDSFGPRCDIGDLTLFCTPQEKVAISQAYRTLEGPDRVREIVRGAVGRRVLETPGCIATQDGPLGIPLEIKTLDPLREDPKVDEMFESVRSRMELPNGRPIADGLELSRHANTMGRGFWAHWHPEPPAEWLSARREWASWCRDTIKTSSRSNARVQGLDSEKPVKDAVLSGLLNDEGRLREWQRVEPLYDPEKHTVAVWFSNEVVETVGAWVESRRVGSIVWVQDREVGQRLSQELRIPYYGEQGLDANRRFILDHKPGAPMIASAPANRAGRNLQRGWSEGLLLCTIDEQLAARSHRPGQLADKVSYYLYAGCREHVSGFWRAVRLARATEQSLQQAMRLCYADLDVPETSAVEARPGARWARTAK